MGGRKRQPKMTYHIPSIICNLTSYLPDDKDGAISILDTICSRLMKKRWVKKTTIVGSERIIIFFSQSDVTPTMANRLLLTVETIAKEVCPVES